MSDEIQPVGMVDRLDSRGSGPDEEIIAFVRAYLAPAAIDEALFARVMSPEAAAAREAAARVQRERDWPNLSRYRETNAARSGHPPKAVFIGDSITEAWAAGDPGLFADGVVGRGIAGQTSPQVLLRFMADVVSPRPAVVHLLVGINDIAGNTGPTTLTDYQQNMTAMFVLARAHGLRTIIGSLLPAGGFRWRPGIDPRPRIAEINCWLAAQAAGRDLVFADYHAALAEPDGTLRAEFTRDGVHPTAAGYAAMRATALAALASAME
jgi:lysophospholipase L1-like esterase